MIWGCRWRLWCFLCSLPAVLASPGIRAAPAQGLAAGCVKVELYTREGSDQGQKAQAYLASLEAARPGIRVDIYDVSKDADALQRLHALAKRFGQSAALPTISAGGRIVVGFRDAATSGPQVEELLTIRVFMRNGCPRCEGAKPFVYSLPARYPGLKLLIHEVTTDPNAFPYLQRLAGWYGIQAPSVPAFFVGGQLIIGYNGDAITGRQIEAILNGMLAPCRPAGKQAGVYLARARRVACARHLPVRTARCRAARPGRRLRRHSSRCPPALPPRSWSLTTRRVFINSPRCHAPQPRARNAGRRSPAHSRPPTAAERCHGTLPGELDVRRLGLPAFTVLVGLVDGFNPCAMWVLVFLLSVLAGLNDRKKLILVAGSFVLVSGLAYFAFMAAWLNVFRLIGYVRPAQLALGILAVVIGAVHIKDFFAFKRGLSLSIPESVKPGISSRVRQIVTAPNLAVAVGGAVVLAVLVNTIELLCTAGLPAIYTQILTYQHYPWWKNYLYLGLYNVAYMLDDTIVLITVATTLSRRRLQEKEGRWLKLISGVVIMVLGLVMLFRPQWLV